MDFTNYKIINEKRHFLHALVIISTLELIIGISIVLMLIRSDYKYFSLFLFMIVPILFFKSKKYNRFHIRFKENNLEIGFLKGRINIDIKNIRRIEAYTGKIDKILYWKKPYVQDNTLFTILSNRDVFLIKLHDTIEINLKDKKFSIDGIVVNLGNHENINKIIKSDTQRKVLPKLTIDEFNETTKSETVILKAQKLEKSYSNVKFMEIDSFQLYKGEICGLIGENGAGKTTLINILMQLLEKDSGSIEYFNKKIKSIKEVSYQIGYVPDIPIFYEKFTAIDYLYFLGSVYKIESDIFDERLRYYLDIFKMNEHDRSFIFNLSLGLKKKLSIIAALLHDPSLIIMDEPLIGLDPGSQWDLLNLLINLRKNGGTILVSSHTLEILEKVCTKIVIIKEGKIFFSGTCGDLKIQTSKNSLLEAYLKFLDQ